MDLHFRKSPVFRVDTSNWCIHLERKVVVVILYFVIFNIITDVYSSPYLQIQEIYYTLPFPQAQTHHHQTLYLCQ